MHLSNFDYELPAELIAQAPTPERAASRMVVVDRGDQTFRDDQFANFPRCLRRGEVLVVNNTKVFPARLLGKSETGAKVEIFLVTRKSETVWEALGRPLRRMPAGKRLIFGEELVGRILTIMPDGGVEIEFEFEGDFEDVLQRIGRTPLPPYIHRDSTTLDTDRERYQTVYAAQSGAIAAPTAGLHFTDDVLNEVRASGVEIVEITLHVGYGTFEPVRGENLAEHSVRPERYEIRANSAEVLNAARKEKRRIVAVGTTTTRALEHAVTANDSFVAGATLADLTITPGYRFRAVNALLTNFHLPQSSLLILVSTFGGHELIMDAYRHAVRERYRFYSYGDCMFIQ
jgi:S-adenosylmethionine:tRNA ribosyltransferase-isomerase